MTEEYYPLSRAVNTYKALEKLQRPIGQNYSIYAYFLLSQPDEQGNHGYQTNLGNYSSLDKALEEVQHIIDLTGHRLIYVCESTKWERIDEQVRANRTLIKPSDPLRKQTLEDLDTQYQKELKDEEARMIKRQEIVRQLDDQQAKEFEEDSVEHYARNWYLTMDNRHKHLEHLAKAKHFQEKYEQRRQQVRTQYQKQPEVEKQWLPLYKDRLTYRGEEKVYDLLKAGHDELYDQVLGDIVNNNGNNKTESKE